METVFCICENKGGDQLRGSCEGDQPLCFCIRIVLSLYFLNLKFQASSHLLWLFSQVYVKPGQKPQRLVFSHIIIIIIISVLEPVFLYRGLGFLTSLPRRRPLHSERFSGSAESIPSFSLSFFITSSHDFLGLPDLFCATTFSLRTSKIQPVLRSTCPNHLILLV